MAPRKKSMARSSSRDTAPSTPAVKANRPRKGYAKERPPIPTKISLAYGAPGRVSMPQRLRPKAKDTDVAEAIQEALDEDQSAEEASPVEGATNQTEHDQVEPPEHFATQVDSEQENDDEEEGIEDDDVENSDQSEEDEDEDQDEEDVRGQKDDSRQVPTNFRHSSVPLPSQGFGTRPVDERRSFTTEAKIASEARIRRPALPFRVKIERLRDYLTEVWDEMGGETLLWVLAIFVKVFFTITVVVYSFQSLWPYARTVRLPSFSSVRVPFQASVGSGSKDLQGNYAVATLTDLLTNQYSLLRNRIDSVERSHERLAVVVKMPPPVRKVNLFALGSGVVIDPYLTSPTRNARGISIFEKLWSRMRGIPSTTSPPPYQALMPWDDMGDCWCAPDAGGKAQLAITLPNMVIPQELVVEHISMESTLDAGATPKDIELWAQILDADRRDAVEKAQLYYKITSPIIQHEKESYTTARSLDRSWVRLGQWEYNLITPNNVQSFHIRVPLDHFSAPVRKFAFRTLSNWGKVDHVCLYRLKLHGLPANATATPDEDNF
ncbi:hypothetical protein MMC10_003675 [Thelotrema lepadinum]|nr:hypothetical protein [Thelotrema lepadinum]